MDVARGMRHAESESERRRQGSCVTLIFYSIDRNNITREPLLNLAAAAAQWSDLTHVEVSIGEAAGSGGQMSNVLRVFNDDVGVVRAQASDPVRLLRPLSPDCLVAGAD